ncbi:MAG: hypothetical protein LBM01_02595 [Christensenellaceae bacterium]|jgi:hypothetical protein|nr:hypothetical protein [Christensenellaceae bacterium]
MRKKLDWFDIFNLCITNKNILSHENGDGYDELLDKAEDGITQAELASGLKRYSDLSEAELFRIVRPLFTEAK